VESKQEVTSVSVPATADSSVLLIRELKIIDDNGQQGVFAKLSRPPQEVTHVLLSNPNRLMIELTGPMGQNIVAERYAVQNPMVEQVHVASDADKIRLTLVLRVIRPRPTPSTISTTPSSHSSANRAAPLNRCASRSCSRSAPYPAPLPPPRPSPHRQSPLPHRCRLPPATSRSRCRCHRSCSPGSPTRRPTRRRR
jgi:hypothetical protein